MQEQSAILIISYGSSKKQAYLNSIQGVQHALQSAFPTLTLYHAITSSHCLTQLRGEDPCSIPSLVEAMEQILRDGVTSLIVLPTYLLPGISFTKLIDALLPYRVQFHSLRIVPPLLGAIDDYLVTALRTVMGPLGEDTAFLYMGHGSTHQANDCYPKLEQALYQHGCTNCYVVTLSMLHDIQPLLDLLSPHSYKKIILHPLLLLAGYHTETDMADPRGPSLYRKLTEAGYDVECRIVGLGEYECIQGVYVRRVEGLL